MGVVVTTVLDLLTLSARQAGILGQDEDFSASEANDAIRVFNDMLDAWAAQERFAYTVQKYEFTAPSVKQVYTLGVGGDFDPGFRPMKIEQAYVVVNANVGQTSEIPMDIVNYDDWARITVKGSTSTIARKVWPDYQYPLINCSVWPNPTNIQKFAFYCWQLLSMVSSLSQTLSFPPGFRAALR